jgi:DNA polymerase I
VGASAEGLPLTVAWGIAPPERENKKDLLDNDHLHPSDLVSLKSLKDNELHSMSDKSQQRMLFGMDPEPDTTDSTASAIEPASADKAILPEPQPTIDTPPPDSLNGSSVYVIDAHNLIYQLFHAIPEMTGPKGEPVGAVFGFARDLFSLLEEQKPDYIFCAFDLPGDTFRHELYADYKANRSAMPDDLIPQIDTIRRMLSAFRIPALGLPGYEADDILATVAQITEQLGGQCRLVTSDKDCRQLITEHVAIYNLRKNLVFDAPMLEKDWGIRPDQVVDFQAITGDSTDNVPGVPGLGPGFAKKLLHKHGSLDAAIEAQGDGLGPKRRQAFNENVELAQLSRKLVRLDPDVPVPIDWQGGHVQGVDAKALTALFRQFNFRALTEKAVALQKETSEPVARREPTYRLVDSTEALKAFAAELGQQKCISIDTETTSLWPRWAEIVGYSFAWKEDEAWYLPVRAPDGEPCLDPAEVLKALRPILEDPDIEKIGQNLKYDSVVLRAAGIRLAGIAFDTIVASYLLDAGSRNHTLDELARRYLQHETISIKELIGSGKNQKRMDEVPVAQVADYAAEDAIVPLWLKPVLEKNLAEAELEDLFRDVEMPLVEVLAELEYTGIRVDVERLRELSVRHGERLASLEKEIYEIAGREFNIASPKQLQQVLFDELGLPVVKKTAKTGPSTDAEVLEELARQHALPARILDYRQIAKLKGTYVDALPEMVFPTTGRVHASFNQVVAATGRLSSSDPNLQNIPIRTEAGREIRSAFVPGEPDWLLLAADYSQVELRVLAHFSQDENLCEAFRRDEDIHARVAGQVYGVELEDVTPEMRRQAKAVNFGVIYGQTAWGLAKQLGIGKDEAAQFIDAYFAGYPGIEVFLDEVLRECREQGYVTTILGRRRAIEGIRSVPNRQRNLAERTAVNTVIQGSAADLIKLAMLAVRRRLAEEERQTSMLLQIHDELVLEVPPAELEPVASLVVGEMSRAWPMSVPLKVDVKVGGNWADAEPME